MGQDAAVPPGLFERIRQMVRDEVAKLLRSGLLRSASIGEGGLTLRGGFLRLRNAADSFSAFYIGPVNPPMPDGTPQPGWIVRRGDSTTVLDLFDADTSDGQLNQALNWRDRAGNAVIADDTNSGQGIARPYVPGAFYPARNTDWPKVTGTTFEAVFRAKMPKQQPKLFVRAWGWNDTAGATGEIQVLVNGTPLAGTVTTGNAAATEYTFGPAAVSGAHLSTLIIEIQARMVAGGGTLQVGASQVEGRQT